MQRLSFLLAAALPLICSAQPGGSTPANPAAPSVYSNPRSGPDDPRVGLKPGLYDAGQAAFGMELVVTMPKPTGFSPGTDVTATTANPAPAASGEARSREAAEFLARRNPGGHSLLRPT